MFEHDSVKRHPLLTTFAWLGTSSSKHLALRYIFVNFTYIRQKIFQSSRAHWVIKKSYILSRSLTRGHTKSQPWTFVAWQALARFLWILAPERPKFLLSFSQSKHCDFVVCFVHGPAIFLQHNKPVVPPPSMLKGKTLTPEILNLYHLDAWLIRPATQVRILALPFSCIADQFMSMLDWFAWAWKYSKIMINASLLSYQPI